jgi:hypothetical protein
MRSALDFIRQHGGALVRGRGGVWTPAAAGGEFQPGMEHVAARAVYALADRGYLTIQWVGREGRASLTQAGIDITNDQQQAPAVAVQSDPVGAALALLRELRTALHAANETPGGPIRDTIWLVDRPCTAFDALEEAIGTLEGHTTATRPPCARCAQLAPECSAQN